MSKSDEIQPEPVYPEGPFDGDWYMQLRRDARERAALAAFKYDAARTVRADAEAEEEAAKRLEALAYGYANHHANTVRTVEVTLNEARP